MLPGTQDIDVRDKAAVSGAGQGRGPVEDMIIAARSGRGVVSYAVCRRAGCARKVWGRGQDTAVRHWGAFWPRGQPGWRRSHGRSPMCHTNGSTSQDHSGRVQISIQAVPSLEGCSSSAQVCVEFWSVGVHLPLGQQCAWPNGARPGPRPRLTNLTHAPAPSPHGTRQVQGPCGFPPRCCAHVQGPAPAHLPHYPHHLACRLRLRLSLVRSRVRRLPGGLRAASAPRSAVTRTCFRSWWRRRASTCARRTPTTSTWTMCASLRSRWALGRALRWLGGAGGGANEENADSARSCAQRELVCSPSTMGGPGPNHERSEGFEMRTHLTTLCNPFHRAPSFQAPHFLPPPPPPPPSPYTVSRVLHVPSPLTLPRAPRCQSRAW